MTRHPDLPTDDEVAVINADFRAGRVDVTGFHDENGDPAPWPDDLDEWTPSSSAPTSFDF